MGIRYVNNGIRKMCALVLVGTIASGVSVGQVIQIKCQKVNKVYNNELLMGNYSDEEVKKNKCELMIGMDVDSKKKVKTYGKKMRVVPKKIVR